MSIPKGQLNLLPDDDYEVLVESIEVKTSVNLRPYVAARCIIQDQCEHKGRVVFWCVSKGWTGSSRIVIEAALNLENEPWKPRYASAKVVRKALPDDRVYNHVREVVFI